MFNSCMLKFERNQKMITEQTIVDAYLFLRKNNNTIPDETLEFMKEALKMLKIDGLGKIIDILEQAERLKLDRFLIAKDPNGFYLRETLCVSHREELGEVHYESKPIGTILEG